MSKVTLDIEDFKTLASETRLDILRAIDQKNMNLKDISKVTKLHETTVHEHLTKLVNSGFVKKNEREGHKWVYYKLSWKGSSLLHPDNTKVVIMFTTTIAVLIAGMISVLSMLNLQVITKVSSAETTPHPGMGGLGGGGVSIFLPLSFVCLLLFCIFLVISIKIFRKNKLQKL